jgi:hypothetical protein
VGSKGQGVGGTYEEEVEEVRERVDEGDQEERDQAPHADLANFTSAEEIGQSDQSKIRIGGIEIRIGIPQQSGCG